jgi:hypothetical protein
MPGVYWQAMALAILTAACGGHSLAATPSPVGCRLETPPAARPFQLAEAPALIGTYRLTTVIKNWPDPIPPQQSELQLWANVPERLGEVKKFGYRPGARPLAGVTTYADGLKYAGAATDHTSALYPAVELVDSTLYLGTPDAFDAVYTALHVRSVSATGFWGTFDGSDGFQITIDSLGRKLPTAEGYFCAERLPAD